MAYLARKVTRAKWERRDGLTETEIPADAISADLRTMNNTLSFWKCPASSEEEIRTTVLALATAAERVDRMDIVWVEEASFGTNRISLNPSDGRTPVVSLRSRHVDVAKLDVGRLSAVARFIADALTEGQCRRLTKKEVLKIVVEAVRQDLVPLDELEPKVRQEIEKTVVA